jgi:hypothetical protein
MVLWKLKVPLHINFFMWYLKRGVVPTKDNLARWNWEGINCVCFVHSQSLYNTYSLIVTLPNFYGGWCKCILILR